MCRTAGTTLVELLTTLTIVAVLATVAIPSFHTFHLNNQSEAIKRGQIVSVCRSSDGRNCESRTGDWRGGWIVFANRDRDDPPERDSGEDLITSSGGWPDGSITSNRGAYSFRPTTQGVVNGTIVFCDARGSSYARAIIISHTGRPRVAQRDSEGKPLRCPSG
jgi:type IV fimbrial biogenesis protein FimT